MPLFPNTMQRGVAGAMRHGQAVPGATIACLNAIPRNSARFTRSDPWLLLACGGSAGKGKVYLSTVVARCSCAVVGLGKTPDCCTMHTLLPRALDVGKYWATSTDKDILRTDAPAHS